MALMLEHFGTAWPAILGNVLLLVVFYLIARILNARQVVALAFGFTPILIGFAALSARF